MAWQKLDTVPMGKYILVSKYDDIFLFLPGSATDQEILERVTSAAQGWTPSHVAWDKGVLGFGSTLRIFGQATTNVPALVVATQTATALNSFWGMTAVDVQVYASDSLAAPAPKGSEWSGTIQVVALAVIALAIVWGVKQVKEISE